MFQRQTMSWREPPPEDEKKLTASYPPELRAFQQCLWKRTDGKRMMLTVTGVHKLSDCLISAILLWKFYGTMNDEFAHMRAVVDRTIACVLDEDEWGDRIVLKSMQMNDNFDSTYAVTVHVSVDAHRRWYQLKSAMYVLLLLGLVWLLFYVLHLLWHILN